MRKSKFSKAQIAMALRQGAAGTPVAEIFRKPGISQATFFRWKKLYGGLGFRSFVSSGSSGMRIVDSSSW